MVRVMKRLWAGAEGERAGLRKVASASSWLAAVMVSLWVGQAQAAMMLLDDFNRPDGTNMGPNWNEITGDFQIAGNRARGSGLGSMIFVGQTSNTVTVDVFKINGGANDLAAIVLGYANTSNNLYIKVQSQNGAANFESLGFYFGNNGNNNGAWSESFFSSSLLTPFSSARLTVSLSGSTVTLLVDSNFDGIADQTISRGSVPVALLGSGIGLGGWTGSGAEVDNFSADVEAVAPEPSSLALLGIGLTGLAFGAVRRRRQKRAA